MQVLEVLALGAAVLLIAQVADAVGSGGSGDILETRTLARSTDAEYYAFPSVCRLKNGELACVFYRGTGHISAKGRIVMVRSNDEGKSWSAPETIIDTSDDDRDPSIVQLSGGRVLVNFFVRDSKTADSAKQFPIHTYVADSGDGRSFAQPKPIDIGWQYEATSDEILELKDGTLLMPVYGRQKGDIRERAAVAFSSDSGKTWNAAPPATVAYDADGKIDFQEPALVLLPSGVIRCCLRTTNVGYRAYESISKDGGKTWSKPCDTGLRGHAAGLLYSSSGVVFHAYRRWSEDGKATGVAAVFAEPNGKWDPKKEFSILPVESDWDCAYPSAVELKDGSILCAYYTRAHRAIEAALISPKAIRALR